MGIYIERYKLESCPNCSPPLNSAIFEKKACDVIVLTQHRETRKRLGNTIEVAIILCRFRPHLAVLLFLGLKQSLLRDHQYTSQRISTIRRPYLKSYPWTRVITFIVNKRKDLLCCRGLKAEGKLWIPFITYNVV